MKAMSGGSALASGVDGREDIMARRDPKLIIVNKQKLLLVKPNTADLMRV